MAVTLCRRLREWSGQLMNPGNACKRLLVLGDSHSSMFSSVTEQRWIYGVCKSWSMNITGLYSQGGAFFLDTSINASSSNRPIGTSQHPTDGIIAPHDVTRIAGVNLNTDTLLWRQDFLPTPMSQFRNGNLFRNNPINVKIGWWGRSDSYQTVRMRSGYTDDTYTTDASNLDMRGASEYKSRTMLIDAANKNARFDAFAGSETETSREWTVIGTRFELLDPTGGVSIACTGNGGQSAADYLDQTTICSDARWVDWIRMWGPFDRILINLGSNMEPDEEAAITTVWRNNILGVARRILAHNATAGGPSDAMALLISPHDCTVGARFPEMAIALDSCSAQDGRLAHLHCGSALPNHTELAANWLEPTEVHTLASGAVLVANALGMAMQASGDSTARTRLRNRDFALRG